MPKTKNINDFLTEEFSGLDKGQLNEQALEKKLGDLDDRLFHGDFDPNDVDYDHLIDKHMPDEMYEAFQKDRPGLPTEDRRFLKSRAEAACNKTRFDMLLDKVVTAHFRHHRPSFDLSPDKAAEILAEADYPPAISASYAQQFATPVKQRIMQEFSCPMAPTGLSGLFSRIDIPCSQYTDRKFCEFPMDPPPETCCDHSNDDDPPEFYGLGKERCWEHAYPCEIGFAFAIHRNLACIPGADTFVRQQIDARRQWFDIIDERNRVRLLFGALDCEQGCRSYPYTYDGTTYQSGWLNAADNGPWTNEICGADLAWSDCNEPPLNAIEQIFEDARDPMNCMPVTCGGDFQVVLTRDAKKYPFMRALQAHQLTTCNTVQGCRGGRELPVMARDGWSTSFVYSRWIWDILVDYYLNCYSTHCGTDLGGTLAARLSGNATLARRTAEKWAENTYVVSKGLQQTFGWVVDYDVSTRTHEGEDTWMYFSRGIRWARRYERKAVEVWLRPWLTLLVRAFDATLDADGNAIPEE